MNSLTQIKLNAEKAFSKIGTSNGTAQPESRDNRAGVAHEYFIADFLASVANKRKEKAKKAAEEQGLLVEDATPGSTVTTYENENMTIVAKTANPAERIDKAALIAELTKRYGAPVAYDIVGKATKLNKAATSYSFAER